MNETPAQRMKRMKDEKTQYQIQQMKQATRDVTTTIYNNINNLSQSYLDKNQAKERKQLELQGSSSPSQKSQLIQNSKYIQQQQ